MQSFKLGLPTLRRIKPQFDFNPKPGFSFKAGQLFRFVSKTRTTKITFGAQSQLWLFEEPCWLKWVQFSLNNLNLSAGFTVAIENRRGRSIIHAKRFHKMMQSNQKGSPNFGIQVNPGNRAPVKLRLLVIGADGAKLVIWIAHQSYSSSFLLEPRLSFGLRV